ncbi:MAG: arginine-tRNA-protein transferase [Patescibacteria group bacterium]|nr:arginine-tRNA-protein transferase [Patescibacteria group bacterium]
MPRIFSSEFAHNYETYSFGYAVYAERFPDEFLDPIYSQGFLPYSGPFAKHDKRLFYMARSLRVAISNMSLSSENRRVYKKFQESFSVTEVSTGEYVQDEDKVRFALEYFKAKHGEHVMPRARFDLVTSMFPESVILEYRDIGNVLRACVLEIKMKNAVHFWFSWYDLGPAFSSLGMWLLVDRMLAVKEKGKEYFYIGTGYDEKSRYKTNLSGLEYWDGSEWIADTSQLIALMKADPERTIGISDQWKQL